MVQIAPPARPRRKPSLTPMIDVVFLLLVFFMLASRFGTDFMLPLPLASSAGSDYRGQPRLVEVSQDGVSLNGVATENLILALSPLMTAPDDMVILRGDEGANVQRLVSVAEQLQGAGYTSLVLVE
ncbi:MAG: biopolymer transporter ExbD [Pseudomonadota bacterium]